MSIFKFISHASVKFAWVSVYLIGFLLVSFIYSKLFPLKKAKNLKRWDVRIFILSKKYHKLIGLFIMVVMLCHGLYMTFYRHYIKHDNFVVFGYVALITLLFTAFIGVLYYILAFKTNLLSNKQKKMIKILHTFLMFLLILFIWLHISEKKWHTQAKLQAAENNIVGEEEVNSDYM